MTTTRERVDAWAISRGSIEAAANEPWHPILEGYARGVRLMKRADTNPALAAKSWTWAANTHKYPLGTPVRSATWGACKHASPYFLPWHRAYLVWFERTIQDFIGDTAWALPYWDYTGAETQRLDSPPEFRVEQHTFDGRAEANPLYVPGRRTIKPRDVAGFIRSMAEYRFVRRNGQVGFGGSDIEDVGGNTTIEMMPHNMVHDAIGQLMRSPDTAAQDPVFWLHHANIDRLWSAWRGLDGSLDTDKPGGLVGEVADNWHSTDFGFGADAAPTVFPASGLAEISAPGLGYSYQHPDLPAQQKREILSIRASIQTADRAGATMGFDEFDPDDLWTVVGASEAPMVVDDAGVAVEVPVDSGQLSLAGATTLPSGLGINLEGVRADSLPHSFYVVEVASTTEAPFHEVGRFSTFGIGPTQEVPRTINFEASNLTAQLADEGWAGGPLVVRVTPDLSEVDDTPPVEGLAIEQVTVVHRP